nr:anti-repressor SinI family protein [Neobacillus sp. Marseille-Q6967]
MLTAILDEKELDTEWVELIMEARNLGISVDEIREFLQQSSKT